MRKPTDRDVDLLLRLYELRREAVLRTARKFVGSPQFECRSYEEFNAKFPPGSDEGSYVTMVISYWDTVGVLVDRGLLNEDLFFQTTFEHLGVWGKLAKYVEGARKAYQADWWCAPLERIVRRHEAWMAAQGAAAKPKPGRKKSRKR